MILIFKNSVCATEDVLLVSVIEPPSLRIIPFPRASTSAANSSNSSEPKRRLWENLGPGLEANGESTLILLQDWDWIIDNEDGECVFVFIF